MNSRNKKIMELVLKNPIQSNILWTDIERLFTALGAELSERSGSRGEPSPHCGSVEYTRLRVKLNGIRAVFHRPHPQNTTDKGAINSVRRFLENAGVINDGV